VLYALSAALAIVAIVLVATGGGAGSTAGQPYPAAVAQRFIADCEARTPLSWSPATSHSYCGAGLSCLEAHVSYTQLLAADQSMLDDRGNPYAAVFERCNTSALRSTPGTGARAVSP
jgi:hypothetical protein